VGNLYGLAGPPRERLTFQAAAVAIGLSVLFLIVYGCLNWFTSLRSDVGTWYYEWERYIPFVPLMVIPYMSIDGFFVTAPFLCKNRRELSVFTRRITLAILAAGTCFLIMPLELAVERPPLEGWLGAAFGWFFVTDKPYNLFPSLHIALRTILADVFARHTRGIWTIASHVWFSLIGFSTLLTYQHHVIDVVGGFVLAALCFYAVPTQQHYESVTPNRRIAVYYLFGSFLLALGAALCWPLGGLLLWPAGCCLMAAAAYVGLGPNIYRKTGGRLPLSVRLVLAPLLIGQWLSLWHYRRQCRPWDEVVPHLWIGRQLTDREAERALHQGVVAVLDLTAEFSEAKPFLTTRYLNVPILDLTAPTPEQLRRCLDFIGQHIATGVVYFHCKVGYSRSAAVVGAYLLSSGHCNSADEAIDCLRAARPSIVVRSEAVMLLRKSAGVAVEA
jgi:membrane-associated phospholipid phosphatase